MRSFAHSVLRGAMNRSDLLLRLALLSVFSLASNGQAQAEVTPLEVVFTNNSGLNPAEISVGFVPGLQTDQTPLPVSILNLKDQTAIKSLDQQSGAPTYPYDGNWYRLTDLSDGIAISNFSGGRVYICYGKRWKVQGAGYEPAQSVTDPNFFMRYDKMEMTYTGAQADVADLTSIDYWSIPMTLNAKQGATIIESDHGLKPGVTTKMVYDALNSLTTPPVSGIANAIPALVPGQFQQSGNGPKPGKNFARIIGPGSYPPILPPPAGVPVTPYNTMQDYLNSLLQSFGPGTSVGQLVPTLGNGVIATISGQFAGVGPTVPTSGAKAKQTYNLVATIDANLDITLTGTLSAINGEQTMKFAYQDLVNPTGIYGGNALYVLNSATGKTAPPNDVYGWVVGDLLSGINIGAVGSQTKVGGGAAFGSLPSSQWFGYGTDQFFNKLQPGTSNFNQWAATLTPLSEAYNFAYSDRFSAVQVTLDPSRVDTLEIVLEPAAVK